MTTVWAMFGSAFYFALMINGWKRAGDYVDVHGLVAMVKNDGITVPPSLSE